MVASEYFIPTRNSSENQIGCIICDTVFKREPSKIYGRQPIKNLKGCGLLKCSASYFLKAVFHKLYLVHFWILCIIWSAVILFEFSYFEGSNVQTHWNEMCLFGLEKIFLIKKYLIIIQRKKNTHSALTSI